MRNYRQKIQFIVHFSCGFAKGKKERVTPVTNEAGFRSNRIIGGILKRKIARQVIKEKEKQQSKEESATNKRTSHLRVQDRPKIDEKFAKRLAKTHKVSSVNHLVLWWCMFANLWLMNSSLGRNICRVLKDSRWYCRFFVEKDRLKESRATSVSQNPARFRNYAPIQNSIFSNSLFPFLPYYSFISNSVYVKRRSLSGEFCSTVPNFPGIQISVVYSLVLFPGSRYLC